MMSHGPIHCGLILCLLTLVVLSSVPAVSADAHRKKIELYIGGKQFNSINDYREYEQKKNAEEALSSEKTLQPLLNGTDSAPSLQKLIQQLMGSYTNQEQQINLQEMLKMYSGQQNLKLPQGSMQSTEEIQKLIQNLLRFQTKPGNSTIKKNSQRKRQRRLLIPQGNLEEDLSSTNSDDSTSTDSTGSDGLLEKSIRFRKYHKSMRDLKSILEQRSR